MKLPSSLYLLTILMVVLLWSALGRPVPMPPVSGEKPSLPCLSYAPFRGDQSPLVGDVQIEPAQMAEDLRQLASRTGCIRTYGVNHGTHVIPALAKEAGLKVMLGIWLSPDQDANRRQIDTAIELARAYPEVISAVVVGNEVLLRGEISPADLEAKILEVKAAVPVPVTYAEVPDFWRRHAEIAKAVDFVTLHLLPYWEDYPPPVAEAVAHAEATRQALLAKFPGKKVFVGEIGWPSAGRMRDGALPSRVNQALFFHEVMALADREGFGVNLIEAFDQPWKREREGTVGGYWGLFDAEARAPKFAWGQPVSNHPFWIGQALAGVLLASLIFLVAAWSARRRAGGAAASPAAWLAVATIALVSGATLGWSLEAMWLESRGWSGWLGSLAWVAAAALAPVAGAATLMSGQGLPPLYRVLGPVARWPRDRRLLLTGWALAALLVLTIRTALMLVFDGRYVDFPYAQSLGGLTPLALLALRWQRGGVRALAEKVAATLLALSAGYILLNEGFANWQALSFCLALLVFAVILIGPRAEPD